MEKQKITNLAQALKTAIEMEIKGYNFYQEVAAKTKNALTRDIFNALSKDEALHRGAIEKYYCTIKEKKDLPPLTSIVSKAAKRDRSIFSKSFDVLTDSLSSESDIVDAYKTAMELERAGYEFYQNIFNSVEETELKDLFKFLLKEENEHYTLIQNTYEYLTRPQDTFDDEERPFFEG